MRRVDATSRRVANRRCASRATSTVKRSAQREARGTGRITLRRTRARAHVLINITCERLVHPTRVRAPLQRDEWAESDLSSPRRSCDPSARVHSRRLCLSPARCHARIQLPPRELDGKRGVRWHMRRRVECGLDANAECRRRSIGGCAILAVPIAARDISHAAETRHTTAGSSSCRTDDSHSSVPIAGVGLYERHHCCSTRVDR
jgi:hypothetical protein